MEIYTKQDFIQDLQNYIVHTVAFKKEPCLRDFLIFLQED